jgi:hypothetical protein
MASLHTASLHIVSRSIRLSAGLSAGLLASLMLLGSGTAAMAQSSSAPNTPPVESVTPQSKPTYTLSRLVSQRVRRDLARRLNVAPSTLTVIEATRETWPDQCLGLARPFVRCRGGEVSGWRVQVASAQQQWVYRSDRTGRQLGIEPLAGTPDFGNGDFSVEISQQLLKTVSSQVNQPVSKLQVLEVQPAVWNGCLGIFEPDQACTMQAIAGFRTSITDGETIWIYHLNENGEQIAQNTTASGAKSPVQVVFVPIETEPTAENDLDEQIVFQSQISGDMTGAVNKTLLLADGKLYNERSQFSNGTMSPPTRTLLKTLSAKEVEAFKDSLEQHRFPNFDNIRYITEAALADYPTVEFQAGSISATYIDLEIPNLPADLQSIIADWNAIIE